MSSPSDSPGSCLERAGFLFAHDCPRPASQRCERCSKTICAEHSHQDGRQVLCTECFRSFLQGEQEAGRRRDLPLLKTLSPLLIPAFYYQNYGYYGRGAWGHEQLNDPNDFTEADGESLRRAARGHHFEEDMQGS